jgi:hypothetical protein
MKIYISNYRNHWISPYTILEKVFFWREIDYDEPIIDKWSDRLNPICVAIQKFLDFVHPRITYVKIDHHDTWSMDHTLSYIILPMLKQLRDTQHGAPLVDDEDVPEELKSTTAPVKEDENDVDGNHFKRWDWVLNEMIWAFEQKVSDDDESQFFDTSAYDSSKQMIDDLTKGETKTKIDWDGLKAHQDRKRNAFRLFGKYFQALWD